MKYINIPLMSNNWILTHANEIEKIFKFCHCTGEDCVGDCLYASIGADDYHAYPSRWNRKECTVLLLKHYKRLMFSQGKTRKEISAIDKNVKTCIKRCMEYSGYNYSGIQP